MFFASFLCPGKKRTKKIYVGGKKVISCYGFPNGLELSMLYSNNGKDSGGGGFQTFP